MNNNSTPVTYRERWLTPLLQSAIQDHSVVVLTGARQVGKSTLLFNAEPFRNWRFHTMDDFDVLEQARSNPESLWAGTNQVILDEVQKAPELLLAVKKTLNGDLLVTVQPSFPYGDDVRGANASTRLSTSSVSDDCEACLWQAISNIASEIASG